MPIYVGAVNVTEETPVESLNVAVPIVGTPGILPPESFGDAISYAEMSPTRTQVFSALLISVAYDHSARMLSPGVALTVTPPVPTIVG